MKKGQVFLTDYILGLMLFIVGLVIAVKILTNSFVANTSFEELRIEGSAISETLLTEGYPKNWDVYNVLRPGLLDGKRLSHEKVVSLMNLSETNYSYLKTKFQTKYDFAVVFSKNDVVSFEGFCSVGKQVFNMTQNQTLNQCYNLSFDFEHHNLVKIERIVAYNSSILNMAVYIWD